MVPQFCPLGIDWPEGRVPQESQPAVPQPAALWLNGLLQCQTFFFFKTHSYWYSHLGMENLLKRSHFFLAGAQVSQPSAMLWAEGTDCELGAIDWAVGIDLPWPPAKLRLQAPRAIARLTLKDKGFNMGDCSPWQS